MSKNIVGKKYETRDQLLAERDLLRQEVAVLRAKETEHQKLKEALINREREVQALLDITPHPVIARFDRQLRHTYVNAAVQLATGIPPLEYLGKTSREMGLPDSVLQLWEAALLSVFQQGEAQTIEYSTIVSDRKWVFQSYIVPEFDLLSNVESVLAVTYNISQRRQAEAELLEHVDILETIHNLGQILSAELDLQKLVQTITDAATELSRAEFGAFFYNVLNEMGESYMLYTLSGVSPESFSRFPMPRNTDIFAPTFEGQGTVRIDDVHRDPRYGNNAPHYGMPKGHLPVTSYLAVPVISRSRKVLGGLFFGHSKAGVFTQRDERIIEGLAAQVAIAMDNAHLYQQAQDQQERLQTTLASIGDAVIATDANGHITFMNAIAQSLTGWTEAEAIGSPLENIFRIVNEFTLEPVENPVARVLQEGGIVGLANHTFLLARDGREIPIDDSGAPIRNTKGELIGVILVFRDITERKAVEAIQSRLSAIVQFSDEAIVSKTLDGIVMSWNAGAERIFGYTQDEMVGKSIRRLFPPERLPEEDNFLQRLSRGEHIRHYETVRVRKDGQRIDISVTLSPIRDASGKIIGVSKIAHDITERKQEEQRSHLLLELSTAFSRAATPQEIADVIVQQGLQSLQARVGAVSLLVEQGTMLELVNSQGLSPGSVQRYRRTALDLSGPLNDAVRTDQMIWMESFEDYVMCYPHLKEVIQSNGSHSIIGLPLKINEKILGGFSLSFPFEKRRTPAEETFFTTLAYLCAQALERARLNAMLEAEHQRLANILATVPGIIWENEHLDEQKEMKLVFISGYVETMLGYTVEEALSDPHFWFKIFHPDDAEKTATAFYEVRRSHGSGVVNFRAVHKDGSVLYIQALMTTILQNGEPVGKRGVMMDVSERQKLLDIQTRYTTMLRRSNEELQRFAYVAAHDLQEPLRMIASYLQLIESRYTSHLDDAAHEFMAYAVDGAVRMKEMLNALLDYARVDQEDKLFKQFDSGTALKTALANLALKIEESNARVTHDAMPIIQGDAMHITRVFQNLISNGIKFQHPSNTPQVHIGVERQKNTWQFCVRDNGIGINPELVDRIFIIFKRLHTREEYPGTGIGLAICKKIIERHGGRIWVKTNPEQGTTFYFTLPV